jgi:hypothetical protein
MLSEGQMSDYTGEKLLYPHLPAAETLIADKGYDSDEFRDALAATGTTSLAGCDLDIIWRRGARHARDSSGSNSG